MKQFICAIALLILSSTSVIGQNIEKKYTSSVKGDETLYFIYPMKNFKSAQAPKDLEYDITYNHSLDSVTYNFTFYADSALPLDSVAILSDQGAISTPSSMLYIEPQKKQWKHRVSLQIAYKDLKTIYNSTSPYEIKLIGKENILFEMKQKDWNNQSAIIKRILEVIDLNKK